MEFTNAHQESWQNALRMLENELPSASYNTWFKPLKLHAVNSDKILIEAPNPFVLNQLNGRYKSMLENVLAQTFGKRYDLTLALAADIERHMSQLTRTMLNTKYTFDNFIVGSSNSFAHAASLAVAEQPAGAYNPLFLYGGVGLGKTHLMNAIGNYILQVDPSKNVLFITSETFTNEFIDALVKKRGTSELRDKMRNVDVLIVDDIQFLAKTTATQEEFFHTFNHLYEKGKQIILSSDRPPNEIPTIEDRLRSRFSMGLTVDIRKPEFETRVAILKRKCIDESIPCDDEVLEYIAGRVESNIRELEGALNRLRAKNELIGGRIDLQFAADTLESILPSNAPKAVTAQSIMDAVAQRYNVTVADLQSKKRSKEYTLPRQVAMYLIREMAGLSTTAIGRELGDRDHTTVMHGCEKIVEMLAKDPTFKRNLEELKESITKG